MAWVTYRKQYRLLQPAEAPTRSYRLLRWDAHALRQSSPAVPELDMTIGAPAGHELKSIARIHDDNATAFSTNPIGSSARRTDVYWRALSGDQDPAGPLSVDLIVWDIAVKADRVLIMGFEPDAAGKFDVVFVSAEKRAGALVEVGRTKWATPIDANEILLSIYDEQQLLGFDGRVGYAQLTFGTAAAMGPAVVGVLFGASSVPPVAYPLKTDRALWSFSMSGIGLVYSRPNALYIARPWCEQRRSEHRPQR